MGFTFGHVEISMTGIIETRLAASIYYDQPRSWWIIEKLLLIVVIRQWEAMSKSEVLVRRYIQKSCFNHQVANASTLPATTMQTQEIKGM